MKHGPMDEVVRYSSPLLELVLWREAAFPFGCRRVWRATAKRSEYTEMAYTSHRKKDCLAWLARVAEHPGQDDAWAAVAATIPTKFKKEG